MQKNDQESLNFTKKTNEIEEKQLLLDNSHSSF